MKQKMYRCAYCPNECETCLEEKNADNMGEAVSVG